MTAGNVPVNASLGVTLILQFLCIVIGILATNFKCLQEALNSENNSLVPT